MNLTFRLTERNRGRKERQNKADRRGETDGDTERGERERGWEKEGERDTERLGRRSIEKIYLERGGEF